MALGAKRKKKTGAELEQERQIRSLVELLGKKGLVVRRENLARGHSFRVKSGDCHFYDDKLLFVDKRLPLKQQVSVLVDFMLEKGVEFETAELSELDAPTRSLLGELSVSAA